MIRHCEAEGQQPEAALTEKGYKQAVELSTFFSGKQIERIITSPFKRAIESIQPLANSLNIEIEQDNRLSERILSEKNLPDWSEKLHRTFLDHDLKFEGGESSLDAMKRIVELVEEILKDKSDQIVIVTHGNLMSLLLNYFNTNFGFNDWKNLSNPDVFLIESLNGEVIYKRIWC